MLLNLLLFFCWIKFLLKKQKGANNKYKRDKILNHRWCQPKTQYSFIKLLSFFNLGDGLTKTYWKLSGKLQIEGRDTLFVSKPLYRLHIWSLRSLTFKKCALLVSMRTFSR